jgi:hypothetical protein
MLKRASGSLIAPQLSAAQAVTLQQEFSIRFKANSNNGLSHAQFVPNTARNGGHSWLIMVSAFRWT